MIEGHFGGSDSLNRFISSIFQTQGSKLNGNENNGVCKRSPEFKKNVHCAEQSTCNVFRYTVQINKCLSPSIFYFAYPALKGNNLNSGRYLQKSRFALINECSVKGLSLACNSCDFYEL